MKKITFNLNEHLFPDSAMFALYAGLRMYYDKKKGFTREGKYNVAGMEAHCLLESLKEQHPEDYEQCVKEYDRVYSLAANN